MWRWYACCVVMLCVVYVGMLVCAMSRAWRVFGVCVCVGIVMRCVVLCCVLLCDVVVFTYHM